MDSKRLLPASQLHEHPVTKFPIFPEEQPVSSLANVVHAWQSIAAQNAALRTVVRKTDASPPHEVLDTVAPVILGHGWNPRVSEEYFPPAQLVVTLVGTIFQASVHIHRALIDATSSVTIQSSLCSFSAVDAPADELKHDQHIHKPSTGEIAALRRFWKDRLIGLTTSPLHCFGFKTPERYAEVRGRLSTRQLEVVCSFAGTSGTTLRTILQSSWALVIASHSQASNGSVAFSTIGRDPALGTAIGPFDQKYVLAIPIDGKRPISEWVRGIERLDHAASRHARIGYDAILEEAGGGFLPASHLHVRAAGSAKLDVAGGEMSSLQLDCEVSSNDSAVSFTLQYDSQIPQAEAQILLDQYSAALESICRSATLADCTILSSLESERLLLLAQPVTDLAAGIVHRLFERQVEATPEATAVQFENEESLTYAALNKVANGVARQLGCRQGALIPVSMPRSISLIVAILAIVKAGCAYVPLDPSVPAARNQFIYQDVDAPFALVSRTTAAIFPNELVIEELRSRSHEYDDGNLHVPQTPEELVYVVYTSGSTGRPKGVLLQHRAAHTGLEAFPKIDNLRQLLFHNPVFSAAQRSIWSTLKQGGCLCLASKENLTSRISDTINSMKVNVIDVTPSTASFITPGTVPSLRRMTVAGELINPALVPLWVNELEFLNAYGLSENTQFNWRQVILPGQNPQNIGRPCDTTTAFVLLPGTTQLAPLLVPGELCLGGHQLARGYLNRPEKTAEVFIRNPFGEGKLYRTGDLVVTHGDGSIEMIGRIDFSVKINDQRVDPGEPNSLIQMHRKIRESTVVAATISGSKALVAVVQTAATEDPIDLRKDLRAYLEVHLPPYMIPTYWLVRSDLPLNINGKVDIPLLQKMCEELSWQELSNRAPTESSKQEWTADEAIVRDILAQVTSVPAEEISPSDSFVTLGGSSLSAIQATSLATKRGLQIRTIDLLQDSTISELAVGLREISLVEANDSVAAFSLAPEGFVIDPDTMEDAFPITPLQEAVLADSLLQKADYMIKKVYRTEGLRQENLMAAMKTAIEHSPLMRSTFVTHGMQFVQVIQKHLQPIWRHLDMEVGEYVQHRPSIIGTDSVGSLGGPMLRIVNLRSSVVVEMHHALCDHWTARFFVRDIRSALEKRTLDKRPPFRSFVKYLNGLDRGPSLDYWQDRLQGVAPIWLEQGIPTPFSKQLELPFEITTANEGSTASSSIYLAWAVVLSKWMSSETVTFGVTVSGRDAPVTDIMSIEGPTLSVAPMCLTIPPMQTINLALQEVKTAFWQLNSHSHVGMHRILRLDGVSDKLMNTNVNVLVRPPSGEAEEKLSPMDELLQTELDVLHIDYFDDRRLLRATSAWSFPQAQRMFVDLVAMLKIITQNPNITVHTAKIMLEHTPLTQPEDNTIISEASDSIYDGSTAEPTVLDTEDSHGFQETTTLSIPSIPKTTQIVRAFKGQAFWSAAWAILLSRHTSTQSPLFGVLSDSASKQGEWQILPQSFTVHSTSALEGVVVAASKTAATLRSENRSKTSTNLASPYHFNNVPFDTFLSVLDNAEVRESSLEEHRGATDRYTLLTVVETPTTTSLNLSSCMEQHRARFILNSVAHIAQAIAYQGGITVKALDIVSVSERAHLRKLAGYDYPPPALLHTAFEAHASIKPHVVALQLEDAVQVTYSALNSRANRLARYLKQSGVREKQAVALYLHKSVDMVASILAVLKVGAFYVPLSPENATERNLLVMDAVDARFLIRSTASSSPPSRPGLKVIVVDTVDTTSFDDQNLDIGNPENLAYIIFTSGSTGTPKGVKVSHRAISTAVTGIIRAEGTDSSWRGLFFFNYIFDAAMHDMFPILSSGGTLCIASEERLMSDLVGVMNEMNVQQLFLMPTMARLLKPEDVPGLKVFIVGGEALQPETIKTWTTDDARKMIQIYGPTEASVIVTTKVMSINSSPRNLGTPMHTASAMILDFDSDHLTPLGGIGELCLAGNQLSNGYWQRDDLTTEAFIPNPLADDVSTSKVYRTGDRARWLPGGELEYLGRIDHQIKLNGFRIELGEIEQTILRTGLVSNCAVTVLQQSGRPQLAAFCIFEPSDEVTLQDPGRFSTKLSNLRQNITALAHYMMPKLIFPLGRFPTMQASTKTDRKTLNRLAESLSNVELARYSDTETQLTTTSEDATDVLTEKERFLQQAWSDLFKVEPQSIKRNSGFFAIGGDSIAAIILVDVCRKAGYQLTVSDIAREKELVKIANRLHRKKSTRTIQSEIYRVPEEVNALLARAGIAMKDIEYTYPCPAGQTEWLAQGDKATQNWVVTAVRQFPSHHDVEAYIQLLRNLTHHNDVLRTTFTHLPGCGWVGLVFRTSIVDFTIRRCSKDDKRRYVGDMVSGRFEFGRPFISYLLLQYPDDSRDLIIKASHGLWDGTSLRIFDGAILALQRTATALPNTNFKDFVFAEHNSDKSKSLAFWRHQLAESIPTWPPARNPITNQIHRHRVDFRAVIDEFAGACSVTPAIVFQAAFQVWQAAVSGQASSSFDYLLTGRNVDLPNPQTINGPCANFLPFRVRVPRSEPPEPVQVYLQRTQNHFWEASEHSNVGLSDIRSATGQVEGKRNTSLFLFQPFDKSTSSSGPPAPSEMRWLVLALAERAEMNQPYALIQEISKPAGGGEYSFDVKYDDSVLSLEAIKRAIGFQVEVLRKWMALGGDVALRQTIPAVGSVDARLT